jgi:nitroimidazol reductase NimA-like FMN-containing flavoprotein (pyridoxamine 5'-phosphate oxidase superfamily)
LDRETCLALLATVSIGRVGWATADGRAMILPVNFVVDRGSDGDTIVFSTSEGEKLDAVREGRTLTFEVDDVERHCRRAGASWRSELLR